ncbi:DUF1036 domain-containing protein [Rhizobium ruizarguesonis]|nr:DUF1036 domain-containing protein [Rhizobium ruizarguesonis]
MEVALFYRLLVAIGIFQLFTNPVLADASTYFCNKTGITIQVATAERRDGGVGSYGWLIVGPGYCEKLRILSLDGESLYWAAQTKPALDGESATSWNAWEDVALDAPVFCVGKSEDRDFHFTGVTLNNQCRHRMRFFKVDRPTTRDLVIRLTMQGTLLATSDESPIAVLDRKGDLVPKTFVFDVACSTRWDGDCAADRIFELPQDSEYCSHFMRVAEINHGSVQVTFTPPGYTHTAVYAVGSGNRFDRWGGNAHIQTFVGVVPFGEYSEDRCLPHASWLGYCQGVGRNRGQSACDGRCAGLSELNQVRDPECVRQISIMTLRWLRAHPMNGTPPHPQVGLNAFNTGFPARAKSGDIPGTIREGYYFSILGSFRTRAAALRHLASLKSINQTLDLDVYLPFRRSRYWVVTNANYRKLADAKNAAEYARDKIPRRDAYVLQMPYITH